MEELAGHGGCILVVDQDRETAAQVAEALARLGYEPRVAADEAQAVELAEREAPLAAIVNVELQGSSGYEVFQRLRTSVSPELPVIFLSAERTEPADRVAGLLVGGDDYLVKPFAVEELVARLHAVLRRAHG